MRAEPQKMIDPKALRAWRLTGGLSSLFYWVLPIMYGFANHYFGLVGWLTWGLVFLATGVSILMTFVIPYIRWHRWRYEIHEHELDLKYGVFVIKHTLIPMVRIQHVDTRQGPILRHYGLSSVTISTAGGSHEIPALSNEVADEVRNRITELARVANEDV